MTARRGFKLHRLAAQDIADIWSNIADDSLEAACRIRVELLMAIRNLVTYPNLGFKRPDLTSRPLRFTVVRRYLIAYAPEKVPLLIIAIMHGRRSPRVMAAILRGRE